MTLRLVTPYVRILLRGVDPPRAGGEGRLEQVLLVAVLVVSEPVSVVVCAKLGEKGEELRAERGLRGLGRDCSHSRLVQEAQR